MLRALSVLVAAAFLLFAVVRPVPAMARSATGPVTVAEQLTCTIESTTRPWNPPGTMDVQIDGQDQGNFQFGPSGNTGLTWSCYPGPHAFTLTANFANGTSTSCSGSFTVGSNPNFFAQMNIGPNGTTCSL